MRLDIFHDLFQRQKSLSFPFGFRCIQHCQELAALLLNLLQKRRAARVTSLTLL